PTAIALAGNAFVTEKQASATEEITEIGLKNWTNASSIISTYFRVKQTGMLHLAVKARVPSGSSKIKLSVNGTSFNVDVTGAGSKVYFVGSVNIATEGYVKVDLQGVSKTGSNFAEVTEIMIGGAAAGAGLVYANDAANYYWSRRGPSCHLNYTLPAGNAEYFYSELMVPAGQDVPGSYFMANGFGEGYFGIQVKSATERWVLFSVWDPAVGQGITSLVRKGTDVVAQRFGGEGTGGQSYLVYNWKAGTTYKFLTKAVPVGAGSTVYTSWFFATETGDWKLMATWSRPNITTYLTHFHGFLENFYDDAGYTERKALWSNQWVRLAGGEWKEITQFKFSVDATGNNKQRMDFDGGMEDQKFYLRNGGFFSNSGIPGTVFTKNATTVPPAINFNNLP
ncbi:MAG: DUF5077 domain-containing protein, partial [Sphingobacteriales bacterium]